MYIYYYIIVYIYCMARGRNGKSQKRKRVTRRNRINKQQGGRRIDNRAQLLSLIRECAGDARVLTWNALLMKILYDLYGAGVPQALMGTAWSALQTTGTALYAGLSIPGSYLLWSIGRVLDGVTLLDRYCSASGALFGVAGSIAAIALMRRLDDRTAGELPTTVAERVADIFEAIIGPRTLYASPADLQIQGQASEANDALAALRLRRVNGEDPDNIAGEIEEGLGQLIHSLRQRECMRSNRGSGAGAGAGEEEPSAFAPSKKSGRRDDDEEDSVKRQRLDGDVSEIESQIEEMGNIIAALPELTESDRLAINEMKLRFSGRGEGEAASQNAIPYSPVSMGGPIPRFSASQGATPIGNDFAPFGGVMNNGSDNEEESKEELPEGNRQDHKGGRRSRKHRRNKRKSMRRQRKGRNSSR